MSVLRLPAAEPFADGVQHLIEELAWLERVLARHVSRLRREGRFNDDPFRGLYVGEAEALATLNPQEADGADEDCGVTPRRAAIDARLAKAGELPLRAIAARFGLDAFEEAVLVIAAGPAMDRRYQTLYAYAQNDVSRRLPGVDLTLRLLCADPAERLHRLRAFTASAPLMRGRLVHFTEAEQAKPLADRALSLDDRVLMALLGEETGLDPRLSAFARSIAGPTAAADEPLLARCRAALDGGAGAVFLDGRADAGQRALAFAACRARGLDLIEADLSHPAARALPPADLGALLAREALLAGAGLLLLAPHAWPEQGLEQVIATAARVDPVLFVSTADGVIDIPAVAETLAVARLGLPRPDVVVRAGWWREALPDADPAAVGHLARATRIGPLAIARTLAASPDRDPTAVAAAAGIHAAGRLPAIAQRVHPHWTWDDLLLPARQRDQLHDLLATLAHWPRVIGDWGFAGKTANAQNCIALFTGASGTGKTMCASLVASSAGLPLFRVDLSAIFDKYLGETEKRLDQLFDAASQASAALLFDEADVLFGKRVEQKDSHDRYANLSVAYLLQRVETFDGLAILTSNLSGNMDDAFARRLAHVIDFPMPDEAQRRALWRRAFPAAAPLADDLDLGAVAATFEISGGNVRNAAIAAAYLAAADGQAIGRRHLVKALGRELEKMGRKPILADFGDLGPGV